ncbi:MAG: cob(I)yrinic acid a,c-diamide adenosyltransferase [Opitutaceae bacterium]
MSISTKRGDGGETSLLHGDRVSKSNIRIRANGSIDELNSALGLCRAHATNGALSVEIRSIQSTLVQVMGELATNRQHQDAYLQRAKAHLVDAQVDSLTHAITTLEAAKGSFKGWEYPGETVEQAFFDHARTTCRRAERDVVALVESGAQVRPVLQQYLNRLSDWLWIAGKVEPAE